MLAWYWPIGHSVHEPAPAAEYDPAAQETQFETVVATPVLPWYLPAAQGTQVEAPVQIVVVVQVHTALLVQGM